MRTTGPSAHLGNGNKGLHRIVRHLEEQGVDHDRRRGKQQGVAVGVGLRHHFRADGAPSPATVFRDDLLAETLGELERDQPPDDVGAPPRRKRDDEPHRFGRIGVGRRGGRGRGG